MQSRLKERLQKMKNEDKIITRLDAILILLLSLLKETESFPGLSTIFYQLKSVGFTNEEIAAISGKNTSQVAKIAYEFKRPKKSV